MENNIEQKTEANDNTKQNFKYSILKNATALLVVYSVIITSLFAACIYLSTNIAPSDNVSQSALNMEYTELSNNYNQLLKDYNTLSENYKKITSQNSSDFKNSNSDSSYSQPKEEETYVLNTSTHKIHDMDCSSINQMADKNYGEWTGESVNDFLSSHPKYSRCQRCTPQ